MYSQGAMFSDKLALININILRNRDAIFDVYSEKELDFTIIWQLDPYSCPTFSLANHYIYMILDQSHIIHPSNGLPRGQGRLLILLGFYWNYWVSNSGPYNECNQSWFDLNTNIWRVVIMSNNRNITGSCRVDNMVSLMLSYRLQ